MRSTLTSFASCFASGAALCLIVAFTPGCRHKGKQRALESPAGAAEFTENFAVAFDGKYTATPVEMGGRAPNDVRDQKLFAARLGHADLVLEVEVQQVWARGRYEGRPEQYIDVLLMDEAVIGRLPKKTAKEQLLEVSAESDLSAIQEGDRLLLFLRWAPRSDPSFRHHLMPKDPDIMALVAAMVAHAQDNGQPVAGRKKGGKKGRRKARRQGPKSAERDKEQADE